MKALQSHFSLSRWTLKLIAFVTMVIDHFGALFLESGTMEYTVCRLWIGRVAYPIFCVLFIESFFYIRNYRRQAGLLCMAALVSVVPYWLTLHPDGRPNIFFSWLFVFLLFCLLQFIHTCDVFDDTSGLGLSLFCVVAAGLLAEYVLLLDYGCAVVYASGCGYLWKARRMQVPLWALCLMVCVFEILLYPGSYGIWIAVVLFLFYDHTKSGRKWKWLYYAGYPIHLCVLWILRECLPV